MTNAAQKGEKKKKEPDWKAIATQLAQRVNFAVTYCTLPGAGFMSIGSLKSRKLAMVHWKDYMADGLEMIPGLKVNRALMHMTAAQRRKARNALPAPSQRGEGT